MPTMPVGKTAKDWNERILESAQGQAGQAASNRPSQGYRIGPEDLIEITVFEVPELSRTLRVSTGGDISLPLIGTLRAAGLTPIMLEDSIRESLKKTYVRDPQVTVFMKEFRSDPVSVVGAVKAPGLYQIQSQRTLIELLAMAQGLSEGPANLPGRMILVTRKQPAAPPADPSAGLGSTATEWKATEAVPIKELLEGGEAKWNIPIFPGDVIKVTAAGTFYVAGDVNRPGGFPLADYDYVSAIQAVAMAGGTTRTAKLKEALIIRRDASGNRIEEKFDLRELYSGKAPDVRLGANDILFVPGSVQKAAGLRAIEASIQLATGLLVFGL